MGNIQKNQTGFGAIEAVLILVIVGMIGFVGWYVLNAQKNTDKDLSVTNTTSVAPKKKATATNAPAQAAPVDQTPLITQAVKDYKDNADKASITNVNITAINGDNAYGTVSYTGNDGGGGWLAHKTGTNWAVVSQGSLGICKEEVHQYNLPISWESTSC
jgi:cytoskeletal protein RodZ